MGCLAARHDIDPSGEIMVLTTFCPVSTRSFAFNPRFLHFLISFAARFELLIFNHFVLFVMLLTLLLKGEVSPFFPISVIFGVIWL